MLNNHLTENSADDKTGHIFIAVCLAGLFLRFVVAWSHIQGFFILFIPDDAFYYFTIARNIALGYSATFDTVSLTNGFHPLWMILLVPVYYLFGPGGDFPIHLALSLSALFDVCTCYLLYKIVLRITHNSSAAVIAATLYFLNPNSILHSVNGMESSVSCMFFALTTYYFTGLRSNTIYSTGQIILLGICAGFAVLGRTDNALLILLILCILSYRVSKGTFRTGSLMILLVYTGIIILPWIVWNAMHFGTIVQVSAVSIPYQKHTLFFLEHGQGLSLSLVTHVIRDLALALRLLYRQTGLQELFILAAVFMVIYVYRDKNAGHKTSLIRNLKQTDFLLYYIVIFVFIHAGIRWQLRKWYFVPVNFSIAVMMGIAADYFFKKINSPRTRTLIFRGIMTGVIAVFCITAGLLCFWKSGYYPLQAMLPQEVQFVNKEFGKGTRIGMADFSGYVGYYSNAEVINIDGVVNNQAFQAIKTGRLLTYFKDNNIYYVYLNPQLREKCFLGADPQVVLRKSGKPYHVLRYKARTVPGR